MIDVNVYLSRWPFRRLPLDDPKLLVEHLRSKGVEQAWCGSFDALLHRDLGAVNQRLVEDCAAFDQKILLPFGSINPRLPDWREDLRRCDEDFHMRGIRVHPNYHGYQLQEPEFIKLLEETAKRKMIVQIPLTMEDERTQHPLVRVAHVDATPLVELVETISEVRIVMLNAFRSIKPGLTDRLAATGRVWFDIAMLEAVEGVAKLLKQIGPEKILLGSYAPFFYFESSELKLRESELTGPHREAIRRENARALL